MATDPTLALGGLRPLDGSGESLSFALPPDDLVTHAIVLGMTGSGKSGLLLVLVEEALRAGVPVVMLDVTGDLPNLLLAFPGLSAAEHAPWLEGGAGVPSSGAALDATTGAAATEIADRRRTELAQWQLGPAEVASLAARIAPRVLTPGSSAGESLHLLSALERPSPLWATDAEAAREALSASISLLLRLVGRDPDPARSRDHVVLSVFAERRLRAGAPAGVAALLEDVRSPPLETLGAMPMDEFLPTLADVLKVLSPRWFVMRNVHQRPPGLALLESRSTMCWLKGPMTRADLRRAVSGTGSRR